MTIPEIRKALFALAVERGIPELFRYADELHRRPAGPRPPAVSQPMSAELIEEIRSFARRNPGKTQVEISRRFHVNQGRVSEALKGKRL